MDAPNHHPDGIVTRRLLVAAAIGLAIMTIGAVIELSSGDTEAQAAETVAQEDGDIDPEIPAGAGRIIGSPEAGPDPQQSGDRGGWLQLLTLAALVGGVGFIMWRIISAARQTPG